MCIRDRDYVDAVIGLGKNLFYNSSMESCLLVCRMKKPKERKGKIIFINAVNEIRIDRSIAYLNEQHVSRIANSYKTFKDEIGFSTVVSNKVVLENNANLSIPLYVKIANETKQDSVKAIMKDLRNSHQSINQSMDILFDKLHELGIEND